MEHRDVEIKFLCQKDVIKLTGLSRTTIHVYVKQKKFPAPFRLGDRAIRWIEAEVKGWMLKKAQGPRINPMNGLNSIIDNVEAFANPPPD